MAIVFSRLLDIILSSIMLILLWYTDSDKNEILDVRLRCNNIVTL